MQSHAKPGRRSAQTPRPRPGSGHPRRQGCSAPITSSIRQWQTAPLLLSPGSIRRWTRPTRYEPWPADAAVGPRREAPSRSSFARRSATKAAGRRGLAPTGARRRGTYPRQCRRPPRSQPPKLPPQIKSKSSSKPPLLSYLHVGNSAFVHVTALSHSGRGQKPPQRLRPHERHRRGPGPAVGGDSSGVLAASSRRHEIPATLHYAVSGSLIMSDVDPWGMLCPVPAGPVCCSAVPRRFARVRGLGRTRCPARCGSGRARIPKRVGAAQRLSASRDRC